MKILLHDSFTPGRNARCLVPALLGLLLFSAIAPLPTLHAQSDYATPYKFTTLAGTAGSFGWTDGTGGAAQFFNPVGVAVDGAGNVFVVETRGHAIRKITPARAVTTFAGTLRFYGWRDGTGGGAQFFSPSGVAADGADNLFVADTLNHAIRKTTPARVVTTFAGTMGSSGSTDGMGGAARLYKPSSVAVDGAGNVYVADTNNHTIRKITSARVVTTFAGTAGSIGSTDGMGGAAQFSSPTGVAVDAMGNVYVADTNNHTIRKITSAGLVTTFAGTVGSIGSADGTGSVAQFFSPVGVAVDAVGNVYVADTGNHTIRKISTAGLVTTIAGMARVIGSTDGSGGGAQFSGPSGVAIDRAGNVYVADTNNHTIRKGIPFSAPLIWTQPASLAVIIGNPVIFTVNASGEPAPTYQWLKDGVNILGATGGSYTISNVAVNDVGSYTLVATNSSGSATSNAAILSIITTRFDFDGNGRSEPLWRNAGTGEVRTWSATGGSVGFGFEGEWSVIDAGDFDGDYLSEPLWRNTSTGEIRTWTSTAGSISFGTEGDDWSVIYVGDYNGDGLSEPLWRNANTEEIRTWFWAGGSLGFGAEGGGWLVINTGDFDGDGCSEPLWRNTNTSEIRTWFWAGGSLGFGSEILGLSVITTGDYNGDGCSEPLWRYTGTGEILTRGTTINTVTFGREGGGWTVIRTGDYNGDGFEEPLWHNANTGEVRTWFLCGGSLGYGSADGGWTVID